MLYKCSGVVREQLQEKNISAVSEKQARYFFSKIYGFKIRDFKAVAMDKPKYEQLSLNI